MPSPGGRPCPDVNARTPGTADARISAPIAVPSISLALMLNRGASPLGLPYTVARSPLRRLAPLRWGASLRSRPSLNRASLRWFASIDRAQSLGCRRFQILEAVRLSEHDQVVPRQDRRFGRGVEVHLAVGAADAHYHHAEALSQPRVDQAAS